MSQVIQGGTEERNSAAIANQVLPIENRGIFGRGNYPKLSAIRDGTSNTILMAERSRPESANSKGAVALVAGAPATFSPLSCKVQWNGRNYVNPSLIYTGDTHAGYRGMAGNAYFVGMTTILPPNSAVCCVLSGTVSPHWMGGLWTATSEHDGGVHVSMADGSVRFINNSIDSGNQAAIAPAATAGGRSPYGVWGALGTKREGESVALGN
jgi:prepilin-type processing-associated H-X9-DG protein